MSTNPWHSRLYNVKYNVRGLQTDLNYRFFGINLSFFYHVVRIQPGIIRTEVRVLNIELRRLNILQAKLAYVRLVFYKPATKLWQACYKLATKLWQTWYKPAESCFIQVNFRLLLNLTLRKNKRIKSNLI